jgi:hemerythrin
MERRKGLKKVVDGLRAKEKEIAERIPSFSTKAKNFAKIQLERIKKAKTYLIGKAKVHFGNKANKEANIVQLRRDLKSHDRVIKNLKDPNRADLAKAKRDTRKASRELKASYIPES